MLGQTGTVRKSIMVTVAGFDVGAYVPRALLARTPDAPRQWADEGTLVFADVSGFTRLSDQLARRGHEGAEDLVSTLVRIFTLLLSASDDGGDLIKFGGDAMVIHYAGHDHERRACHAAYMMQRVMRVAGDVELTGARARLRMSIGVHSGRFDFLLPGHAQQDLVVTGDGVSTVLALEAAADPGETLVSATTARALPASCLGPAKGPGHLLRRVATVPSTGSQILFRNYDEEQVWRHLPTVFRERPDLLGAGSDHRRAAMAFVSVTGLDALVDKDPVGVLARMDDLARVVEEAAAETGISVLDTDVGRDGYKYFLAAGAPTTLEDPEGRMLRALLRITRTDTGLEVRAGCAAGRVFAGTVGAPFRCTYAAMGDTTNLAARLCARAEAGQVVAHSSLLARSLTLFDSTPVEHLELKGKPEPVPVVRVRDVIGQRSRATTSAPFVGREVELAAIVEAWKGLGDGDGGVVEIVGEAGLGKTRLADTALGQLGLPVLSVSADPYGAFIPYHSLRMLLRALLGLFLDSPADEAGERLTRFVRQRVPHLVPWLPLLAPALGATLDDQAQELEVDERFRVSQLHETVRDLLTALLPEPTALMIDDAHWMDESSAEALAFAFSDLRGRPWAVALTRRDGEDGLHGGDQLRTTLVRPLPLAVEDAELLVASQARALRPDEVEAILGRGGGNPYFLLQLAGTEVGAALPESVEELVGSRIDRLDAAEREMLRDAAVLGTRFHRDLYVEATGDLDFPDAVRGPALAAYLDVAPDGTVSFRRDLYREVAYGQLSFRNRRQLHVQAARAIEANPRLAGDARLPMLSLHYAHAGLWERAYRCSLDAGDEAKAAWANEEAVQFYRRAYDAGKRLKVPAEHLASLGESIGDVLQVAGRFDDAVKAYRESQRLCAVPGDRIRLMLRVGRMLDHEGRFAASAALYRRARALATGAGADGPTPADPLTVAEIDVADASSRHLRGRNAEGRDLAALAWESTADLPDTERVRRLRARAAFIHDTCAGYVDGPRGHRFGDMPLRLFEALGDHYYAGIVANNLGILAFESGRWKDAITLYTRGGEYSRRAGDRVGEAITDMNIGEILGYQGHLAEAESLLEEARRIFTVHDVSLWYAQCCAILGAIALGQGDTARARALLTEAGALDAELGATHESDHVAVTRLDLLLHEGDLTGLCQEAASLLDRREPLAGVHESRARRALGAVYLRTGDPERARTELERARELARGMESRHDVALAELQLAALGGPDAAGLRASAEAAYAELGIVARPPVWAPEAS